MRVLAVADIHGNHAVYRWLASLVVPTSAELVLLAGDLFGFYDGFDSIEEAQRAEARDIHALLATLGVPVFYIMGNDDWMDLGEAGPTVVPLNMRRVEHGSFNFVGYQHTLPFMGGPFEKTEEEIAADLDQIIELIDERTVLLTHGPAEGILDLGIADRHAGSASLARAIEAKQPRAHIHGHIHRCFGREGIHFNVAAARGCRCMLIDLATMEHEVLEGG